MISTSRQLLSQFADPDRTYRTSPYWVWNGRLSKARITEMLEQFSRNGCGGVTVHARIGLITEYLSDEWFEMWGHALSECKRLGLQCNIFDENNYPPPSAGGHVFARIPDAVQRQAVASTGHGPPGRTRDRRLGVFLLTPEGPRRVDDPSGLNEDAEVLVVDELPARVTAWIGGMAYVDPLRPEVAREFIATTHEGYRTRFGKDFGSTIRFCYNDEVGLRSVPGRPGLPMSSFLATEFEREHGYDVREQIADLFVDGPGCGATRFDYYATVQRLFEANYWKPLYEWCSEHNLEFTGHLWEHCWPEPFDTPDSMACYRWLHIPGVDVLAQQFDPQNPRDLSSALTLLTIKEAAGAARQLGRDRLSCEAYGGIGYEASLRQLKRRADWFCTHGVNLVVEHLGYQSTAGVRKYDWPQTFSDHSPWWSQYRELADHTARLCLLGSAGTRIARTLVLHPTTTGWVIASLRDQEALQELRDSQAWLVQWLCDRQVDFDLGDELLMRDLACAKDGRMAVGQAVYDVVVVPEAMGNLCESTVDLLESYLQGGGRVLSLGEAPVYVNGREDTRPGGLAEQAGWRRFDDMQALGDALDEILPPLVADAYSGHLPPGIAHQARALAGGTVLHLLANTGTGAVSARVRLQGRTLRALDALTGCLEDVPVTGDGDRVLVDLKLPAGAHRAWLVDREAKGERVVHSECKPQETLEILEFESIRRCAPNVLQLDYCDLTVARKTRPGIYVLKANDLCWQAHGFDGDAWSNIQYRRNFLDMEFGPDTGFDVEFTFRIDPDDFSALREAGDLRFACERPGLYGITLNGELLPFEGAERWFDESIKAARIRDLVVPGENRVRLSARPFHVLCEVDRVYVIGEFDLIPCQTGFRIAGAGSLAAGDWTRQGMPFYNGSVRYEASFHLSEPAAALTVQAEGAEAAAVAAGIDGGDAHLLGLAPRPRRFDGPFEAGQHVVTLELFTGPRNLLGPHFWRTDRPVGSRFTGRFAWWDAPDRPPAGEKYELVPYGLSGPVTIVALSDDGE